MSIRNLIPYFTLAIVGLSLGAGLVWLKPSQLTRSYPASPVRTIASTSGIALPVGKHRAPITIQFATPSGIATDNSGLTEIIGYIFVHSHFGDTLNYRWQIPSGVTVVQGHLQDQLYGVQQGQVAQVSLLVRGFSAEESKTVSLEAYFDHDGRRIGNGHIIQSRQAEGALEDQAPEMMKAKLESLRSQD